MGEAELAIEIIKLAIQLEPAVARMVGKIMDVMANEATMLEEKRALLESFKRGFEEMVPKGD